MPVTNRDIWTSKHFRELIGEPPLIKGESEERYWCLWYAFEGDLQPKGLSEWIRFSELVNKYWEQLRLRSYFAALIEGACAEALIILLEPHFDRGSGLTETCTQIARSYYAGDAESKKEAVNSVRNCGINEDQIFALAMQMRGSGLSILDRMDNHRQNVIRGIRKEMERSIEDPKPTVGGDPDNVK